MHEVNVNRITEKKTVKKKQVNVHDLSHKHCTLRRGKKIGCDPYCPSSS